MKSKLKKLENKIFFGDHTDEEWKQMYKDVNIAISEVNESERKAFLDSGASELIAQIMEFMDD